MVNSGYTAVADPDTTAKALGREMPVSPKFAREVAGMVRGMKLETAQRALEEVIEKKRPVPLKRYNKRVSHKAGVGPGRYPVKAAKAILSVIDSAAANAEFKGLDTSNLAIATISVSRGQVIPGHMPRAHGRATEWNQDTINVEVILQEVE
ncbi:MAG: 50S ribosomal protein L22 [Thermoplasmata archaeon]|jgi:large subunit ribosomal protein L22|nr:50S ribosomal protein L22 [Thermoplasmata archaeon]MBR4686543.1 50S ribosomal protein L22 [Candidatus Methanomethylophilaceae archaeon]WII06844.1 50S ribosomal protein L22 [Methanomassiliicoccales archaeon LGM-RCC1]